MVYVLNKDGKPLMPTTRSGRVRRLLKSYKAIIVNYQPFTIKLTYSCHNRQLHKASILVGGIRKNNQAQKEVFGFRLMDTVRYDGQVCYVNGRRTSGYFSLVDVNGKVLTNSVSYRKLNRINHNNYIIGGAIPLTH